MSPARRRIAALLAALAIAVPRAIAGWQRYADLELASSVGIASSTTVSSDAVLLLSTAALIACVVVLFLGRRGMAIVALVVLAHSIGDVGTIARKTDAHAEHADAASHIESPDGAVGPGLRLLVERGRVGAVAWPFAPLLLIAGAFVLLGQDRDPPFALSPRRALGGAVASGALSLLVVSLWSQHELRSHAIADELVVIGHGAALWFSARVGARPWSGWSLATAAFVFGAFAFGFGFAHHWKPTRSLCSAATSTGYDRATREAVLRRAQARLRSPISWIPARVFHVAYDCDRAAEELGL